MMIQEICISGGGDSEGAGRPGQCADKGVILREPEIAGQGPPRRWTWKVTLRMGSGSCSCLVLLGSYSMMVSIAFVVVTVLYTTSGSSVCSDTRSREKASAHGFYEL